MACELFDAKLISERYPLVTLTRSVSEETNPKRQRGNRGSLADAL